MATSHPDQVSLTHEKEFTSLRRKRRKRIVLWLFSAFLLILFFVVVPAAILDYEGGKQAVDSARSELLLLRSDWGRSITSHQYYYAQWLSEHGTKGEVAIFNYISRWVLRSAIATLSGRFYADRWPLISNVYLSLHSGLLRVFFVILVSWRIWLTVALLAGVYGFYSYEVYNRSDLLGELGNNRFFFSGIQADLSSVNQDGLPESQITGLACPKSVPLLSAASHPLGRLLHKYQAANQTTMGLAAIIIRHADYPAYLAIQNEEDLLKESCDPSDLDQHSAYILEKALLLQASYKRNFEVANRSSEADLKNKLVSKDQSRVKEPTLSLDLPDSPTSMLPVVTQSDDKYSSMSYAVALQQAFDRVLTTDFKRELSKLTSVELAAVVLAYQAGKVLAYGKVSGKWVRKSSFPQLSARAVLHSLPSFSNEFTFESRTIIRRALIYAARKSAFASVRFPVDMSIASQALRQWVELLMASPYELQAVADEVELFAYVSSIHQQWTARFLDGVAAMKQEILRDVFVSPHNLIFISVKQVLEIAHQFIPNQMWPRLHELSRLVSNKNRLVEMACEIDPVESELSHSVGSKGGVLSPFSKHEIGTLARAHNLKESDVRDWGVLRIALNSFAWLGRRVGDYTVPPTSLIFAVFSPEPDMGDQNSLGLVGRRGMVAFRTRRLEERFGKSWRASFIPVNWAKMAENVEDYQKLLNGADEIVDIDKEGTVGVE